MRPDAVRNNCRQRNSERENRAPSSARIAREACASNSNCHQISRRYATSRKANSMMPMAATITARDRDEPSDA